MEEIGMNYEKWASRNRLCPKTSEVTAFVCIVLQKFFAARSWANIKIVSSVQPRDAFRPITCERKYRMDCRTPISMDGYRKSISNRILWLALVLKFCDLMFMVIFETAFITDNPFFSVFQNIGQVYTRTPFHRNFKWKWCRKSKLILTWLK